MYRFQIIALTQTGKSIGLVGSVAELGLWDVTKCLRLQTSIDRYPLWWADTELDPQSLQSKIEYKYVCLSEDSVEWEPIASNRWVAIAPTEPPRSQNQTLVIDDGTWGYEQPYPFGYVEAIEKAKSSTPSPSPNFPGNKVLVIGSSVARGHKAWLLDGWAALLGNTLRKSGHHLVNVSEVGANVSRTIARFNAAVAPEKPDIVIIALSLGNEGLAHCQPHQRHAVQRRFESGLQQLIKMTRELGAYPVLGGVYPHGDYDLEHRQLLQETHDRLLSWGVPVLDWWAAVDDGKGCWKPGIAFDPAHPNTLGHRLMYEAIDLKIFDLTQRDLTQALQEFQQINEVPVYQDEQGFEILAYPDEKRLRILNLSPYSYTIAPHWQELQAALQHRAKLMPGLYVTEPSAKQQTKTLPFLAVQPGGAIETVLEIPPNADVEFNAAFSLFSPNRSQLLFYDGNLGILKEGDRHIRIINESNNAYNIQPMWKEVCNALKAMPSGVYEDPLYPDAPFRTMMIGDRGLESRVKAPPRSAIRFQYKCKLSDISRVAILPLGDRCAVRMMLYKMEYDGPAFPFDLTRTTKVSDVADMIESRFHDMWNPALLHYSGEAGRIYHQKWSGLSFAHEVDDNEDPIGNIAPIHKRMRDRYSARAARFFYAIEHCDKVLFVRTGVSDRGSITDLIHKLQFQCGDKPFHLLLLSPQDSHEFAGLPHVLHHNVEFNPDRMYDDLGHWQYCADQMRGILESLGVSSKNLFWCPPKLPG